MWIFGYGSLIWRPGFAFEEAHTARLEGFARRFWQGSPDHRGTPDSPGRVVTLVEHAQAWCLGRAFRVNTQVHDQILADLDVREQGGYVRHRVPLRLVAGARSIEATTYVAREDNPNFLGPAPFEQMVRHIAGSRGPSGPNDEYLLELADWLRDNDMPDAHVQSLADALRAARASR